MIQVYLHLHAFIIHTHTYKSNRHVFSCYDTYTKLFSAAFFPE